MPGPFGALVPVPLPVGFSVAAPVTTATLSHIREFPPGAWVSCRGIAHVVSDALLRNFVGVPGVEVRCGFFLPVALGLRQPQPGNLVCKRCRATAHAH